MAHYPVVSLTSLMSVNVIITLIALANTKKFKPIGTTFICNRFAAFAATGLY